MENSNNDFHSSLDLTSEELEKFIPALLNGLWDLGSMPEYIIEILDRNDLGEVRNIIDLGCGKGAVLIKLAAHFSFNGIGIDIVPEFIGEAKQYAENNGVSDKVSFKVEDITESLKTISNLDLVIYGYDSEVLGDLKDTIGQLSTCIKPDGHIILEYMFGEEMSEEMLTEDEMMNTIDQAGYLVLDRKDWSRDTLKDINRRNTEIIHRNVDQLISKYPDKKDIFNDYLQNQIKECEELENDYFCTTLLLRQKTHLS